MTELARYLSNTAQILLRNTLEKLATQEIGSEHYTARIYQALMLAHDAGYPTGVMAGIESNGDSVINAFIELPTGTVRFTMPYFMRNFGAITASGQDAAIREFVEEESWWTSHGENPYNGHCRECYAFKGRYGGECVEPECKCHGKGEQMKNVVRAHHTMVRISGGKNGEAEEYTLSVVMDKDGKAQAQLRAPKGYIVGETAIIQNVSPLEITAT